MQLTWKIENGFLVIALVDVDPDGAEWVETEARIPLAMLRVDN